MMHSHDFNTQKRLPRAFSLSALTRFSLVTSVASVALLLGCDNSPPNTLQTPDPNAQTSKIAPASAEQKPGAPLPDEFHRFEYSSEGRNGLDIGLNAEEVISGVRLQTEVNDAEPGKYFAVFHENGACDGLDQPKLGQSVDLMSSGEQRKGPNGGTLYSLGEMEVNRDGNGHVRWLTAVGNLRPNQAGSLLGGVFALYSAESNNTLGRLMACVVVEDQKG